MTLWIDTKTHLPLKRVTVWNGGKWTESYIEFKLGPRLDSDLFELPKRK